MGAPEIEGLYFGIQSPFPGSRPAAVSAALTAECNPLRLRPPCTKSLFRGTDARAGVLSGGRPPSAQSAGSDPAVEFYPVSRDADLDLPGRSDLNSSTGGRCRHIPGIRRSAGFNEKNMGLVLSDRTVLNALGHYKYFAWTEPNSAVSQLNSDMSNENQKEVVSIVMLVPNKFTLDLDDHEVVTVEAADDVRLPIF